MLGLQLFHVSKKGPMRQVHHNSKPLQWHHDECDGISNHQPHDCLLNRLFRHRSNKTSKFHITGLCAGNSPVTGEFPAQRANNVENVSIWWCHHSTALIGWFGSKSSAFETIQNIEGCFVTLEISAKMIISWAHKQFATQAHTEWNFKGYINPSSPSAAYMLQRIGSTLVQIMAWHLFGAKPLSEPMLSYCQMDP